MQSNDKSHRPLSSSSTSTRSDHVRPSLGTAQPMQSPKKQLLYAQPSSVHFGGFALGETYQQRVFIYNHSHKSIRLQYTLPTKKFFRAKFATERRAFLSAGLAEELIVSFHPTAFQYYYDCIQVRCEEVAYSSNTDTVQFGKCLIPLHGYPVVNQVEFPSRMDFGVVPLGEIRRKHIDLTCSVPIDFEYRIDITQPHRSFTIFPLSGIIPANSVARIEIEFKPLIYATATAEMVLHVSHFGFNPLTCVLAGSSAGDAKSLAISAGGDAQKEDNLPRSPLRSITKTTTISSPSKQSSHQNNSQSPSGQHKSKSKRSMPTADAPDEEMEKIDNIEIPVDLSTPASVSFILNQQPGKLRPKDLKKAIDANRALKKQQQEEQTKLSNTASPHDQALVSGDDEPAGSLMSLSFHVLVHEEANFLQRTSLSRQTKQLFFLQELADAAQQEKELEFQSHKVHLGMSLLTPAQLKFLKQIRLMNRWELDRRARERMRRTFTSTAYSYRSPSTVDEPHPPRAMLPAHFQPQYIPDFKTHKNDLWARRRRVVQKFVRAVSTVIIRWRVQTRLEKVKQWLGDAKTRAQVQAKMARKQLIDASDSGNNDEHINSPKTLSSTDKDAVRFYLKSFPLVEAKTDSTQLRQLVPLSPNVGPLKFDSLTFFQLKERDEALLCGHEPMELPPLPTYVPLETNRRLRTGAVDESGVAAGSLMTPPPDTLAIEQLDTKTPSLLAQMPADVFLRPTPSVRPLVRIHSPRETDPAYVLRPQRVFRTPPTHFGAQLEECVGMRSLVALKESKLLLHDVFNPSTDRLRADPLVHWTTDEQTNLDLYADVWSVTGTSGLPALAQSPQDISTLSDSESDEEDQHVKPSPVWRDAELLFESTDENKAVEAEEKEAYEEGERLGWESGIYGFERYQQLVRLEQNYNAYREELLKELPKRLYEVSKQIDHPDYQLVVEGHGPDRPLHQANST